VRGHFGAEIVVAPHVGVGGDDGDDDDGALAAVGAGTGFVDAVDGDMLHVVVARAFVVAGKRRRGMIPSWAVGMVFFDVEMA